MAARLEARDLASLLADGCSEQDHQVAVATYLDRIGAVWCHVPNGGKRGLVGAVNLKRAGVKRGVPDVLVFGLPGRKLPRVALELKSDSGRVTQEQRWWAGALSDLGWTVGVAWNAAQAVDILQTEGYR